jgi:hypothetical protein
MKTRKGHSNAESGATRTVGEHTPTPWKVSQTGKFVMHSRPGTLINVCEASEEDAAFIVKAVNAYEEVLQLARFIRDGGDIDIAQETAREIIAKAERGA